MRFACTLCGDCCTGSQVVRLTGGDLELLVRRLSLGSVTDLRSQGVVSLVREPAGEGTAVWRPRIRFRTKPLRQCPFLSNDVSPDGTYRGLCSLHPEAKPLVCSLSPLARAVDDPGAGPVSETWSFVPPVEGCPGVGRGPDLPPGPPADLRERLDAEVRWMRRWTSAAAGCGDESSAWALLGSLEAFP
jgi:Fe-S-cluster containining protein